MNRLFNTLAEILPKSPHKAYDLKHIVGTNHHSLV